jgi:hypothetical protein
MFDLVLVFLIVVHLVLNYLSSYFFFKIIPLHLVFILDLIFILLIVMYLVLNPLLNRFVFEFHPLTFYFYIKYDPYFLDCYF